MAGPKEARRIRGQLSRGRLFAAERRLTFDQHMLHSQISAAV